MKRMIALFALLLVAGSMFAQTPNTRMPNRQGPEQVLFDPEVGVITDWDNWRPLDSNMGYAIYGSRYRRARADRGWGMFLTCLVAPASAIIFVAGVDEEVPAMAAIGALGFAGSLGAGIPLWIRGRRQLDWMLDDYARRFGPRPYSSLTAGPTANGLGLALNF